MVYERGGSEYVIYTTAVVVEGEIMGGVFDTEFEALEDARGIVAEFEGMTADQTDEIAVLAGLNAAALEDRINEQDIVGFAVVAQRSVLYSQVHHERG